jgi:Family of unknown function (DUF5317)
MLVLSASVVAALSAVLLGGRLSKLVHVRLRVSWLPLAALLLQMVILQFVAGGPRPLLFCIHVLTYVMAGVFIWLNRAVPGLLLVAVGALSNGVTIALNHGTLPASTSAMAAAHVDKNPALFLNSGPVAHPVLGFLGDMFAWPAPLPFANVFSIGDVLIVLGAGYGAHRITGSRLPGLRRGPAEEAPGSNVDTSWGMIEAEERAMVRPIDERS